MSNYVMLILQGFPQPAPPPAYPPAPSFSPNQPMYNPVGPLIESTRITIPIYTKMNYITDLSNLTKFSKHITSENVTLNNIYKF